MTIEQNPLLRADIADHWRDRNPFDAAREQPGSVYRDKEGRRTLRFEIAGRGYFLKLHQGIGWKEIVKNLLQGRLPVVGATNEYLAIRALEAAQIDTLSVAAFGRRGINPATQLSFLVTDELTAVETLEDFCARWIHQPPTFALKAKLIERVAGIARVMHRAGINHRDFYLCHFLLQNDPLQNDSSSIAAANLAVRKLYLMDLHRAQIRARVPRRWLIKDLGGLYYSALDIGLTQRDIFRFVRHYTQRPLRVALRHDSGFWAAVRERARRIYVRDHHREPQSAAWALPLSFLAAFSAGARKLPDTALLPLIVDKKKISFKTAAVLRLLPRKRVVLKGSLENCPVVIKLFARNASSARHIRRERAGYERVAAANISCPALLGHFVTPCGRFEGIVYEFIAGASELSLCWPKFDLTKKRRILQSIMQTMLTLHRAGIYQSDIHADNFMLQDERLYLLDLGSIKLTDAALPFNASIINLGALIAQFDTRERALFDTAIDWYVAQRGWQKNDVLQKALRKAIDRAWQVRKRDYLNKALRDCSLTVYKQSFGAVQAFRRDWQSDDLARFYRDPDAFMASGTLLKAGNTATVVRATIADRPVVIKRYNIKNWRHAFGRGLRPTRARHSWLYSHLLEIAGIAGLQPVALLERRCGPLRSTAYFISAWIDAPDLLATGQQRALSDDELQALKTLLEEMSLCRISHGDFKANNLLLRAGRIALIDLDAMREHCTESGWRRAFKRDLGRLLRNWPENNAVFNQVKYLISTAQPGSNDALDRLRK
ncbi:MAG TPA: lipopolysaccharide core heptose(I) kinase RfaP [Spongiibacteraceae bacterium]